MDGDSIIIKEGDIVMLKSGGPLMTVEQMVEPRKCECSWMSVGMPVQRTIFPVVCLTKKIK